MLSWFRKKRQAIIPLLSAVFLGSLVTFYCPHCPARMDMQTGSVINQHKDMDCLHMEDGQQAAVKSQSCCTGRNNCEEHSMVIEAKHSVTITGFKRSPDHRLPFLRETTQPDLNITYSPSIIGRPYKPDRACYPPLERNCVLLN